MNPTQQPTEEVLQFAFAQVAAGVRPFDVQRQLVANGWDTQTAALIMNQVRQALEQPPAAPAAEPPASQPAHGGRSLPPPFPGAKPPDGAASRHSSSNPGENRKIPWRVYRDLVVGGIFVCAAVAMGLTGLSLLGTVAALLFGVIQIGRAVLGALLSQYRI